MTETEPLKNILAVDDDALALRLVRETLNGLPGVHVETTTSPEYAFELVLKKPFDLLILDFAMPGMDGALLYTLVSRVFTVQPPEGRAQPPMLLFSGNAGGDRAQELLRQPGVRGLLAKPVSPARLEEKVREILGLA